MFAVSPGISLNFEPTVNHLQFSGKKKPFCERSKININLMFQSILVGIIHKIIGSNGLKFYSKLKFTHANNVYLQSVFDDAIRGIAKLM